MAGSALTPPPKKKEGDLTLLRPFKHYYESKNSMNVIFSLPINSFIKDINVKVSMQ